MAHAGSAGQHCVAAVSAVSATVAPGPHLPVYSGTAENTRLIDTQKAEVEMSAEVDFGVRVDTNARATMNAMHNYDGTTASTSLISTVIHRSRFP